MPSGCYPDEMDMNIHESLRIKQNIDSERYRTFLISTRCLYRSSDHPLRQLLIHYQSDILQRLRTLITNYMQSEDDANQAANIFMTPHEQTADHHMDTSCEPELEKGDLAKTNCIVAKHTDSQLSSHIEASPAEEEIIVGPPFGGNTEENIAVSFGGNTGENIVVPFGGDTEEVIVNTSTKNLTVEIRKHLRTVSQEMHRFLHRLLLMFAVAYEQLDGTMAGDLVYDGIEETFFVPVWSDLIALFRLEFALHRHYHCAAVVSRGWAKASACCLQLSLSCAIVSFQYLSRSSLHHLAGLPCRIFLSYGLQVVTSEVQL